LGTDAPCRCRRRLRLDLRIHPVVTAPLFCGCRRSCFPTPAAQTPSRVLPRFDSAVLGIFFSVLECARVSRVVGVVLGPSGDDAGTPGSRYCLSSICARFPRAWIHLFRTWPRRRTLAVSARRNHAHPHIISTACCLRSPFSANIIPIPPGVKRTSRILLAATAIPLRESLQLAGSVESPGVVPALGSLTNSIGPRAASSFIEPL